MKSPFTLSILLCVAVGLLGCASDRLESTEASVVLSVSDFDGLPIRASVNGTTLVQVEQIQVQNIAKNPNGATSELMNVEMESYEVIFTRGDTGTRLPPPFVRNIFGVVPANGVLQYDNLPVVSLEQLENVPLSDLLVINGGFDKETGESLIVLNLHMRFFGRTVAGDQVDSQVFSFTVEFVP